MQVQVQIQIQIQVQVLVQIQVQFQIQIQVQVRSKYSGKKLKNLAGRPNFSNFFPPGPDGDPGFSRIPSATPIWAPKAS